MVIPVLGLILGLITSGACDINSQRPGTETGESTGSALCEGAYDWTDDDMAAVFADDRFSTYSLTLPDSVWANLQANATDEEYVSAVLEVDSCEVGSVGLRFKGAYGSLHGCFDETGEQICDKLPMKIKFDYVDDAKRFHGLKRLNFHSMIRDDSLMHDRLAYSLFREMGVTAPRATHAQLVINGESLGVFGLVEQVDGRFTDDRFADGDGNLYKERWPQSDDPGYYAYGLKTNEESADHTGMLAFSAALQGASEAELPAVVGQFGDPAHYMRYLAVDQAILNWDGIMAWYCQPDQGVCGNHNFYFYESESAHEFTLIPWDLDNTFALATPFDHIPAWTEEPTDCGYLNQAFSPVRAPACDPLIRALALTDRQLYLDAVGQLLDGPFALDAMYAKLDAWEAQIAEAVAADPTVATSFGPGLQRLRDDLVLLRQRLENTHAELPSEPFVLVTDATNDFESTNALSFALGAAAWSSDGTTVSASLETEAPLAGNQHGRLDFEFADNGSAWGQVALLRIAMEGGTQNLAAPGFTGIRLRARADQDRTVRFDLESPAYSDGDSGHRFGWELSLTAETQVIELSFADAQMPAWAPPSSDDLQAVLQDVVSLIWLPTALGRDANGFLGDGVTDPGFLAIDDVEFVTN